LKNLDRLAETDFRRSDPRFQGGNLTANIKLVDRITEIAAAKGVKPSQLAIAWTMSVGTVPIPGTRRTKYLEENVAATEVTLTSEELRALDEVAPIGAATGDRYSTGSMRTLNH
jgi:aryl-alcohol dehydrogenase-like predicted oxidoreductase